MERLTREILTGLMSILIVCSCNNKNSTTDAATGMELSTEVDSATAIIPEYAEGFSVKYLAGGIRLVDVKDPGRGADDGDDELASASPHANMPNEYKLALVAKDSRGEVPEGYTRIEVPIERAICMTSLQISNLSALGCHDNLVGLTGTKNLYNEDILQRVKDGKILKIGMEGNFDTEKVMAANPDIIFISPFKKGGYEVIKETGITLVPHLGYKEPHPLGQAEWIKYVAMFLGKEAEANEVFEGIKERYNSVKALAAKVDYRPTVFSGEIHGGNWFAIGGKNFLAQMFHDAGARYVLEDDTHSGGIPIDFEQMYLRAAEADYWRILNSYQGEFSYEALKASNSRNADFKAFKERHVIYCNMKKGPYYESTPVEPDVLLKDLVGVFHPELLPSDYEPTYYKLLR